MSEWDETTQTEQDLHTHKYKRESQCPLPGDCVGIMEGDGVTLAR